LDLPGLGEEERGKYNGGKKGKERNGKKCAKGEGVMRRGSKG